MGPYSATPEPAGLLLIAELLGDGQRKTGGRQGQRRRSTDITYSVPLSTICVSSEMPSRLMNSWAKVMSRDALARSFRASSLASMLDDWIRSCSWTAVWYWERKCVSALVHRGASRAFLPAGLLTGEVVKRRMEPFLMWLRFCGGFNKTREDVSEHADLFLAFAPQLGIHKPSL